MFNSINNPFDNRRITSSTSSDADKHQRNQQQNQNEERNLLQENEQDEVKIGGMPILTEDEILFMVKEYIAKLKDEHSTNEKVLKKLDKYLANFNIKKFMKQNPNMTSPDFHMIMFNETSGLLN
jgi:transcriptional antiterminator